MLVVIYLILITAMYVVSCKSAEQLDDNNPNFLIRNVLKISYKGHAKEQ